MLYGLEAGETEERLSEDADALFVPRLMERACVPRLAELVERCWDPCSTAQTLRLVGLAGRIVRRYPTLGPASTPLRRLFSAVADRVRVAVERDVFLPLFWRTAAETRAPFFQRQLAAALKLLRNVASWQGLLCERELLDLALVSLLNRQLLPAITACPPVDAVAKAGLVSRILPRVWLQAQLTELRPFATCVSQLAQQLDKDNPLHLESIDTVNNILKAMRCT